MAESSPTSDDGPTFAKIMMKKNGSKWRNDWRPRWFEVKGGILSWWDSEQNDNDIFIRARHKHI